MNNMKIDAYINLHKDVVSVRSRETEDYGTVVQHQPRVGVKDVEFVVQQAGRQAVLNEKTKNVHAFVRGRWDDGINVIDAEHVVYDPYEHEQFYCPKIDGYVSGADRCIVTRSGVFAKGLKPYGENSSI